MIPTATLHAKSAPRTRWAARLRAAAVGALFTAAMASAAAVELTMWVMPVTTNAQHDVPDLTGYGFYGRSWVN